MITAAQQPSACRKRAAINSSMLGANPHNADDTTYSASPYSSTGLRPKRSDSGPMISCAPPKPMANSDSVNCTVEGGTSNTVARLGSDAKYRSVDSGCIIRKAMISSSSGEPALCGSGWGAGFTDDFYRSRYGGVIAASIAANKKQQNNNSNHQITAR